MASFVVYKHPIVGDRLTLPVGAYPLHVDVQRNDIYVWALHETPEPEGQRHVVILGTGHTLALMDIERLEHINTFLVAGGEFVFHAFEVVTE